MTPRARWLEFEGERLTLRELAERTGVPRTTLHRRLERGMSVEDAVRAPRLSEAARGAQGARRSPWSR